MEFLKYLDADVLAYFLVMTGLFGAAMGSFLYCVGWRTAHGESWIRGRSRCPACGHTLGAAELIPVFSWLILRGKCKWCGGKVPIKYLYAELLFAAVTVMAALRFGVTVEGARNYIFLSVLFVISVVDLEIREIPNPCVAVAALAWVAAQPFLGTGFAGAAGHMAAGIAMAGGVLVLSLWMDKVLGRESMGGGDIKLMLLMGMYLGMFRALLALFLACAIGLASALPAKARGGDGATPFGPALAAGTAVLLLLPDRVCVALYEWLGGGIF